MTMENPVTEHFRSCRRFGWNAVAVAIVILALFGIRFESLLADDAPAIASQAVSANGSLEYRCRVIDKITRQAVPNARVTVVRSVDKPGVNRTIQETKHVTDANGFYDLIILPDQLAMDDLYVSVDIEHDEYAAKKGLSGLLTEIRSQEKSGARPFFEATELCPGNVVTGTVVSPDGKPVPGIFVRIWAFSIPREPTAKLYVDVKTDESGQFCFIFPQKSDCALWIIPKSYAPIEKFVAKQQGDLGVIKLAEGVRVNGFLKSVEGTPLNEVAVQIEYSGPRETPKWQQVTYVRRGTLTDADGRFEFDPVAPGEYTVVPSKILRDPLLKPDVVLREVPAVFVEQKITVPNDAGTFSVKIPALPHVIVSGHCRGHRGDTKWGIHVYGKVDGVRWDVFGHTDREDRFSVRIPHGLQQARAEANIALDQAASVRLGEKESLQDGYDRVMELGTINNDLSDIEIVYYKSPVVLISAVDDDQKRIPVFQVVAKYAPGKQSSATNIRFVSDLLFHNEQDGRYRTSRMRPDEETTFKIMAPGYEAVERTVKIPEGESQDLVVTLKKQTAGNLAVVRGTQANPVFRGGKLNPGDPVTGTVVSPDGKPLQGVKVRAFSKRVARESPIFPNPNDSITDQQGQFSIVLPKDAETALWIIPKDFAPIENVIAKKRGDLGIIKLAKGVRVRGQVKTVEGKAFEGVAFKIEHSGTRPTPGFPSVMYLRREAISDANGRFEFDPVAPGEYIVEPADTLGDPSGGNFREQEIPGVFVRKKITIKGDTDDFSVSIQEVPHVVVSGQCYGNRDQKNRNEHIIGILGQIDGMSWSSKGRQDDQGAFSIKVPHGLHHSSALPVIKPDQVMRYRLGKEGPLQHKASFQLIDLGMLNDDLSNFEIYFYKSPVVVVSAVDEEQKPVAGFHVDATYPWSKQQVVAKGGMRSDVNFVKEPDGRQRTGQILPDEEVTFKVTAPSFEPAEKMLKLAEGETQILVITMKKQSSGSSNVDRESK